MIEDKLELIHVLTKLAHQGHFWCDGDNWYSCPKAPYGCDDESEGDECNCGADEHNEKVAEVLAMIIED
jgi:hypothetical protein